MSLRASVGVLLVAVGTFAAEVTVHYHNVANVEVKALHDAILTASRAFESAGVPVRWVQCVEATRERCMGEGGPRVFEVSIVENAASVDGAPTLGHSLLVPGGGSTYAKVFLKRVLAFAKHVDIPASRALGYTIAHEVGRLLLESGAHANFGIMKASWSRSEGAILASGRMVFNGHDAKRIRQKNR